MTDFTQAMADAMDFIATAEHGKVVIERRGKPSKTYPTVALRVEAFRRFFNESYGIVTEQVGGDSSDVVVVRARIYHYSAAGSTAGRVIACGHAEEVRGDSSVNRTSALENCETSAIGRALAAFGLVGEEMASANEVESAVAEQQKPLASTGTLGDLQQILIDHGMSADDIDAYRSTLRIAKWTDLTEERAQRLLTKMQEKAARQYATDAAADAQDRRDEAEGGTD